MPKWLIGVVILIGLVIALFALAGWSERPIIDYSLTQLWQNYDASNSTYPMLIRLGYDNRGEIGANLNLVLTATNANVLVYNWTGSEFGELISNGSQGTVHVAGNMAQAQSPFATQYIWVFPYENPANFTLRYSVEDVSPVFSPDGLISHLFQEQHGNVTTAVYERVNTTFYQLLP